MLFQTIWLFINKALTGTVELFHSKNLCDVFQKSFYLALYFEIVLVQINWIKTKKFNFASYNILSM